VYSSCFIKTACLKHTKGAHMVTRKRQSVIWQKSNRFDLPGSMVELDFRAMHGEKGLLVMFICNHCPYLRACMIDFKRVT